MSAEHLRNEQDDIGRLYALLDRAIDTMASLHRSIEPMHDDPELAGRVPPAAMRAFVDSLAAIDYERWEKVRG